MREEKYYRLYLSRITGKYSKSLLTVDGPKTLEVIELSVSMSRGFYDGDYFLVSEYDYDRWWKEYLNR